MHRTHPTTPRSRRAAPRLRALVVAVLLAVAWFAGPAPAQAPSFVYQGELLVDGAAFDGLLDLQFALFDADAAGTQVGSTVSVDGVAFASGRFEVELDFGIVFDGSPRWLEIRFKAAGSLAPYQTLYPRQPVGSAPAAAFSLRSDDADTVDGEDAADLSIQDVELVGTELRITQGATVFTQDLASLTGGDADMDDTNELNTGLVLSGTELRLTDAGGTLTVDLAPIQDGVDDADADPTNELITSGVLLSNILRLIEGGQITNEVDLSSLANATLTLDGTNLRLTDGGGTLIVDLSPIQDGVDDADADPTNELNTALTFDGTNVALTDAGGTLTADLSSFPIDDADADPAAELISDLYLTNNNDTLEIVEDGLTNALDVTPLQNSALTFDGTSVSLTDGGGTLSVDLSALEDDADPNPANELNTSIVLSGTDLELTDAGGTLSADLSTFPVEDADANPIGELISDLTLTNGNDTLALVEGGLTNLADVTPLQNSALTFDGTSVSLTDGGGTLSVDLSALENDADADPTNELNTGIVLNGTDLELTDGVGTVTADLSTFPVDDADADPTGELIADLYLTNGNDTLAIVEGGQTNTADVTPLQNSALSFDGTSVSLTDGGGTLSVDLSALQDDADADPTNELNTALSFDGTNLSLSDSGGALVADLSALPVDDADADPTNERITSVVLTNANGTLEIVEGGLTNTVDVTSLHNSALSFDGTNVQLSDANGTLSVDLSALEDDADADPTNELNTSLTLTGTNLMLTDSGGTLTVDLSVLQDGTTDADADPANELIGDLYLTNGNDTLEIVEGGLTNAADVTPLQNTSLSFDGTSVSLTDGAGTLSVDLSALEDDADASSTNELNTALTLTNANLSLTDSGGTLTVDLSTFQDGTDDADADPTNELIMALFLTNGSDTLAVVEADVTNTLDVTPLQNTSLALDGVEVDLTDGGGVLSADLSALIDTHSGLSLSNNILSLTDPSGTLSVDLSSIDGSSDLDTDPTSELITSLVLNGTSLEISESGNMVTADLSALNASTNSVALYSGFGWSGAEGPVGTGSSGGSDRKILDIVEAASSNRFEVDFNRIRPGIMITNIPITISQPGYYYLIGNLSHSTLNQDGIVINADNVTVDLNGFTLFGGKFTGVNSDDGIVVLGTQTNIKVYNGGVVGWNGDGINALNADFSIFRDIYAGQNNGDGLVTDFNCLLTRITAFSNGIDGIEGDDGTVIHRSTAGQNGDNGIQTSEGSAVVNCNSFDNETDGIDVAAGSVVNGCVATDNGVYGFDIALGGQVVESSAYDNISNGFDIASACVMRNCISSRNEGHGVRTFANSYITENKFHDNTRDGIRISSTDGHIQGNQVTDNDGTGINNTSSGSLFIQNTASGNLTNFNIDPNSAFGPILDVTFAGDLSGVTGADHPWANFVF